MAIELKKSGDREQRGRDDEKCTLSTGGLRG
jgi:hypothetical protein